MTVLVPHCFSSIEVSQLKVDNLNVGDLKESRASVALSYYQCLVCSFLKWEYSIVRGQLYFPIPEEKKLYLCCSCCSDKGQSSLATVYVP